MTLSAQSLPDAKPEAPHPDRDVSSPAAFIAVVAVSALVVILCVLGSAMSGLFDFTTSTGDQVDPASTAGAAGPGDRVPVSKFQDGQWLVAGDIQPGTYSVTVDASSSGCTWERNASTDGNATSVLESGDGAPGEALVVGIKDTDKVFQSRGCGTWQRTSD